MLQKIKDYQLLAVLGLTGFVTSFGAYIVAANLPAYSRETGAGLMLIGFLIALYDIAEILVKPLGGLLSRTMGEWRVLRMGLALFSLASGLYLILPPGWLVVVRLLQGAGAAFFSIMSMTLLIRHFQGSKGMALGVYGALKNTGYVLAPTIGGFFVYFAGFRSIFGLCMGVGLLVIVLTYSIQRKDTKIRAGLKTGKKRPGMAELLDSLKNRQMLPIFMILFFNMMFMAALFGFMPVLLSDKGLDPVRSGLILAINATIFLSCQPFSGKLSDTLGRKKMIIAGLTLSTFSVALIPFLPYPFYVLGACLLALGIGCVSPLGEALIGDASSEDHLSINLGIAGSYRELGEMAGPLLMGLTGQWMGLHWSFVLVGISGVAGLLLLWTLRERQAPTVIETARQV